MRLPMSVDVKGKSGFTLIQVLVALPIAMILTAAIVALFTNTTDMFVRINQKDEAEDLVRYVYSVLAQKNVCDNALRDASGAPLTWDLATQANDKIPVGRLEVDPDGPTGPTAPTVALQPPKTLSTRLRLTGLYIRQPDPATYPGELQRVQTSWTRKTALGLETYDSVSVRFGMSFDANGGPETVGGALRDRYVNLTLSINRGNHRIEYCYPTSQTNITQFSCSQAQILTQDPGTEPTDCPPPPDPACVNTYYVSGFRADATPLCSCSQICPPPPKGGPGGGPGGGY